MIDFEAEAIIEREAEGRWYETVRDLSLAEFDAIAKDMADATAALATLRRCMARPQLASLVGAAVRALAGDR